MLEFEPTFSFHKLHYNISYKVPISISGHILWNVPIYCINIRAFTFDVPNVMTSRNNDWCKWGNFVWQRLFFVLIAGFIITFQIKRNNQTFHWCLCHYLMSLIVLRQLFFPSFEAIDWCQWCRSGVFNTASEDFLYKRSSTNNAIFFTDFC